MPNLQRISAARRYAVTGEGQKIREAALLTCRELGKAVGVDGGTIFRWERHETLPQGAKAVRYADILDEVRSYTATVAA
jgi:DNA-binding XRE family transcriptional regulator